MSPTPGDLVTLSISDIAFGGEGIARANDFVVFVPFVAVGEIVEAEITEVKKNFARAQLKRVINAASDRTEPACRYYGDCGGCQYQHLAYSRQLTIKHKQIRDLLQRIGGFNPDLVSHVVPCPEPYHYRNRIMIRSQWDKYKKGLNIGFIRSDNRLVVDIEECKIAEPALNQQITEVRKSPPPKGGIKVVLRVPPKGWVVPKDSFFQNNFHLLPQLVKAVRERLTAANTRYLIDLYCGVGFFGLELADLVQSFLGVEIDHMAIKAARQNAVARGVENGEFLAATAEETLDQWINRFALSETTILIDPPRTGCPKLALDALRSQPPAQVLYVSCHPATMARDLNILCRDGVFELAQVVPFDMFPQTSHVECVADVRIKSKPANEGGRVDLPTP